MNPASPAQFEPLLPSEASIAPLLELAHDLIRAATHLDGKLSDASKSALTPLLWEMNSYFWPEVWLAANSRS